LHAEAVGDSLSGGGLGAEVHRFAGNGHDEFQLAHG
jgi:hypothetical protein